MNYHSRSGVWVSGMMVASCCVVDGMGDGGWGMGWGMVVGDCGGWGVMGDCGGWGVVGRGGGGEGCEMGDGLWWVGGGWGGLMGLMGKGECECE